MLMLTDPSPRPELLRLPIEADRYAPHMFEDRQLTARSTLADLVTYRFEAGPDVLAGAIDTTFRTQTEIPGVLIVEEYQIFGIMSRRRFFEQLGQLYGTALFLKRPIASMLDPVSREWLQLPSTTLIHAATTLVFQRPERWVYEPIVVEFSNQSYALLDIRNLLIAQTHLFENLQRELQLINEGLEDRVQERTAELALMNEDLTLARDQALEASRLKTELLAHVSHELRTPLGAVLGFSELLSLGLYGPVSGKQQTVIGKIGESSRYLSVLVDDLLDQAQLDVGKMQLRDGYFHPNDLIETVMTKSRVLAQKKDLPLVAELDPAMPTSIRGDQVRLEQILLNLVSNAIKFTEQGRVQIRLYRMSSDRWAMEVSDTGCGIPCEAQTYIFEPFRQVDGSATRVHRGTGLGLSIVQQLTTLMEGKVQLFSEVNRGSTFIITLPLQT